MIPQFLLDDCKINGKILVLQPRRIAARMLAGYVAAERGSTLGTDIGFQTRLESRKSRDTRILYITAGILPRMLLSNPTLPGIEAIVFDEFHERSINTDIGLGLIKHLQDTSRPDLKLAVMSATLETENLKMFLGESDILECDSRRFPVAIGYAGPAPKMEVWDSAARALGTLLKSDDMGDVLIFMPGVFEIQRTIDACKKVKSREKLDIKPLHANLPVDQQNAVMRPSDFRKIIVTTNVAETSLTVPGVGHVIDSGLARVNRFDPSRGLNTLHVESISQASADQRSGRAGREFPGRCIRLWTEREHERRPVASATEIERVDLAETILQLNALGFPDITAFPWLTPPKTEAVAQGNRLLRMLGATDAESKKLTKLGYKLASIPCHPRISRMLLEASQRGCATTTSLIAAALTERPVTVSNKSARNAFAQKFDNTLAGNPIQSDLFMLVNALRFARDCDFNRGACADAGIHGSACRHAWRIGNLYIDTCKRHLDAGFEAEADAEEVVQCVLLGFPDHLARRRDLGSLVCELPENRRASLENSSSVKDCEFLVAIEIREIQKAKGVVKTQLSLASEVKVDWLIDLFENAWRFDKQTLWNSKKQVVEEVASDYCLDLLIHSNMSSDVDQGVCGEILADAIIDENLVLKGWTEDVKSWIDRVQWLSEICPEYDLPAYDDNDRRAVLRTICNGKRRYADVRNLPYLATVKGLVPIDQHKLMESMAPPWIPLPSGRRMKIKYRVGKPPRGNAKIQDLYGLVDTPAVAGGRQKLLIEILAPNMRPVQVTDDIAGFWGTLYPSVKKELARRYPKHEWR